MRYLSNSCLARWHVYLRRTDRERNQMAASGRAGLNVARRVHDRLGLERPRPAFGWQTRRRRTGGSAELRQSRARFRRASLAIAEGHRPLAPDHAIALHAVSG